MLTRRLKDLRYSLFYSLILDKKTSLQAVGDVKRKCAWMIHAEDLNEKSIVYSGGVGNEMSFERDLAKIFGCTVILCDPSPTGSETMSLPENQDPRLRFNPIAITSKCGVLSFAEPLNPDEGSWFASAKSTATQEFPCINLPTLMAQNNHDYIDLLKIDIEGSEYEVIDQILETKLPVRQIAVEYHNGVLPGVKRSQTTRSIFNLMRSGYKLISQESHNHTFYKK